VSIRIEHGTVITVDKHRRIIQDGAVVVEGQRIREVGKATQVGGRGVDKVIDARGKLVLPGLVDTHVHNEQTLARGLGDDVNVNAWTYQRIFPYEVLLDDDAAFVSALLSCVEMIRTGTTCCADTGGYHPDAVARAMRETGFRGVIAWPAMDVAPPGFQPPAGLQGFTSADDALRQMEEVVHRWYGQADGRIRSAYSLRTAVNVSETLFREAKKLADRDGTFIEMHLCTHEARVEATRRRHGTTVVDFLDRIGVLGSNWLFIHAPYISDTEVRLLKNADAKVSHPIGASLHGTYGSASRGKFPELLALGVTVGLGCDSTAANNSLDMFRAINLVATVHKEVRMIPDLIRPEKALEMATIDAARALGWDDQIGSLEVGKLADIIVVNASGTNWIPMHDFSIVPNLVYSGEGRDVETVIIDGTVVMENREIRTVDVSTVLARAQSAAEAIVARLPYRSELRPTWRVE
jgi:5-methylthioadenosine/S-adenosylhomocysteine deaminase